MDPDQSAQRALLYEREGVVRERAQALLEGDGAVVCSTGNPVLFQELRAGGSFDLLVAGVGSRADLDSLDLAKEGEPVVLLVPGEDPRLARHLRVALPAAAQVDRSLHDPDALRRALGGGPAPAAPLEDADPVRATFEPFGLSERQLEVLRAALLGGSPAEIGAELFISELTVRNHLHAIYERVGVGGRRELLGRFVRALLDV